MTKKLQPPTLTKITNIVKHPNADTLEIAKVLGFQIVVKQNTYKINQTILYFEPETAFIESIANKLNIAAYLQNKTDLYGDKVLVIKEVNLRGEISEGLILPEYLLNDYCFDVINFPCFKYEAGSQQKRCEDAEAETLKFPSYGSLENLRKSPSFFTSEDFVTITEKIHGTNSRIGYYFDDAGNIVLQAGSRTASRKAPGLGQKSLYWEPYSLEPNVLNLFKHFQEQGIKFATIYGEIYGPSIQSYTYGLVNKEIAYKAFTIKLNGLVLEPEETLALFEEYQINYAPVIYKGLYSYETVQKLAERGSLCTPMEFNKHLAEGLVIQNANKIAKYVSNNFLLSKSGKNKSCDL